MKRPGAVAAAVGIAGLLATAALWWTRLDPSDPIAELGNSILSESPGTGPLERALARLYPASWRVDEATTNRLGSREFTVRTRGRMLLAGMAGRDWDGDRKAGWLVLMTGETAGEQVLRVAPAVRAFATSLFCRARDAQGTSTYLGARDVLRRLGRRLPQDGGLPPALLPAEWEIPGRPLPGRPFVVNTGPGRRAVAEKGFLLFAVDVRGPGSRAFDELAQSVADAGREGATVPAPRLRTPAAWSSPFRSEADLVTGEVPIPEAVDRVRANGMGPLPGGIGVSGVQARLLMLAGGPGPSAVSVLLETIPEGVKVRALLDRVSPEAQMLARLPELGCRLEGEPDRMPGQLVWSGRFVSHSVDCCAGDVFEVTRFAFEWRPESRP